ncbi:hypothetical protein ACFYRG_24165 [Streptomyces mirabilis]|uniref:hypothetical protein n=1 Tax=Streptomyces mirabilis TaxID=68239 RepID=UPI0036A4B6CC
MSKSFTDAFWGEILRNGTDGAVLLGSPAGGGHSVDPGTALPLDIQVVYPDESPAYERLIGLNAQQLG